ncbi:MAG: hypothetical protein KA248_03165 [Kiritimatiellae bacterium]|nr:hypothetical protein [Kiritimatiellia bacterium]
MNSFRRGFCLGFTLSVCVAAMAPAATLYVWTDSPSPAPPFADWATAAHTIQEAIDAGASNDLVVVTNGVYDTGGAWMPGYSIFCRAVITNGVRVESVNGPAQTFIAGGGPIGGSGVRCAYLSQGAALSGFTLTNGHSLASGASWYDMSGGGAFIRDSGTISNCVITGNRASQRAGGVMCFNGGQVLNSVLCDNHATNNSGGGVFIYNAGLVSHCTLHGNSSYWNGGGVEVSATGLVTHSTLYGNWSQAGDGGAVDLSYGGGVNQCVIYSNRAGGTDAEYDGGGGVHCFFGGGVTNSAIFGNSAPGGGGGGVRGIFGGSIVNCSIFDNQALVGGGVFCNYYVSNYNNIIYHNQALNQPNWATNGSGNFFWANCLTPLPVTGGGNITNDPWLAGVKNWRLLAGSPCINAGSNVFAQGIVLDLDGEPRLQGAAVDMGCDEFNPTGQSGGLSAALIAAYTQTVVNIPLTFYADTTGQVSRTEWRIQTDAGTRASTNAYAETQSWSAPGAYEVVLSAFNDEAYAAATVSVQVLSSFTNYASELSPGPAWPYATWETAATSVYQAVQALPPGGVTLIYYGNYPEEHEIVLDKPATLIGEFGPAATLISGLGAHRVFRLTDPNVALHGLGIQNGYAGAEAGGGVLMLQGGVISNCWIIGNVSSNDGAGVYMNGSGYLYNCVVVSNRGLAWGSDGGGVYFNRGGVAEGCRFEGNYCVGYGGGAYFNWGGTANDGWFLSNLASNGGGGAYCNYRGTLRNGRFLENASAYGGGLYVYYGGSILNPHVAGNTAWHSGGGMYISGYSHSTTTHATVQGNIAGVRGGGVYASSAGLILNSILYYNTAPLGENFYNEWAGYRYDTCCMTPAPSSGAFNILTNAPLFAGIRNPHLMAGSPCIDAASNALTAGITCDVDGEPRTNGVAADIGCDEYWAGGMTGTLSVAILATYTTAVVNTPLPFTADVQGKANSITWQVGDAGATNGFTNVLSILYAWPNLGAFPVVLTAFNDSETATTTVTVTMVEGTTNYVDLANPSPVAPYTNWATAANGIQTAVDAAPAGGAVLVTNGHYPLAAGVAVAKPLRLEAVNGPESVTVDGQGAVRVFTLTAPGIVVAGFTVTNGYAADNGGGILCGPGMTVTNCRLLKCAADAAGGGVYLNGGGTVLNSRFEYNRAATAGGGVYCSVGGFVQGCEFYSNRTTTTTSGGGGGAYVNMAGTFLDCVFTNNKAGYRGGGAASYYSGVFSNCLLARNEARGGAGLYLQYSALAQGCTISNNVSTENGGGVMLYYGSIVEDSRIVTNRSQGSGGGVYADSGGTLRRSIVERNSTDWNNGAGLFLSRGGQAVECTIASNRAAFGSGGGVYMDRMSVGVTNCQVNGNAANIGGGVYVNGYGAIVDSTFTDNRVNWEGGGVNLNGGGNVNRCLFRNNSAQAGGGVRTANGGTVSNSVFIGNTAYEGGGFNAIFGGRILNSFLAGNTATNAGGGLALFSWGEPTEVRHCTVVGNTCYNRGGGLWTDAGGLIRNTILYDNLAAFGNNWFNDGGAAPAYDHCCTTPDPGGAGHLLDPPLLAGRNNPHLLTNSPCVNAGDAAWAGGVDIDNEARIAGPAPDIGCDEVDPTNFFSEIHGAIDPAEITVTVQTPVTFQSDVEGQVGWMVWGVPDPDVPGGWVHFTNTPSIAHSWNTPGDYTVILSAFNGIWYGDGFSSVHVTEAQTNYVAPGGLHVPPFASWENASTSIAEAVSAAAYGGVVLVSNGVYREQPAILVDKPLTIRSVNGWEQTTMDGQGTYRCYILFDTNVVIEGFTFSNGFAKADMFGGGGAVVLIGGGTVRYCRFLDCQADQYGGGALCYYGGSVQNSHFTGNSAMFGGGALCYYGGEILNSTLVGNRAFAQGGGVYCEGGGAVLNTISYYNDGAMGPNWFNVGPDITYANVCTDPLPPGPGHLTNAPGLAGINNPHLLTNAPCLNAGSNAFAAALATDWDGETRILGGRVEIGCDEFYPPGLTGTLAVAIAGSSYGTSPGFPLEFWAVVDGKPAGTMWAIETGGFGTAVEYNALTVSYAWAATGRYPVVLSAYNNTDYAAATVTVTVADGTIRYVDTNGLHNPPFLNWADAAHSISAAVAVASAGDTILITNGVYREGTELIVSKPLHLIGVNGPEVTIVDGTNQHRVFRLEHSLAVLEGLGITRGNAAASPGGEGGGVVLNGAGQVINCHIFSNQSPQYAGGVLLYGGGTVTGCVIRHNRAEEGAGAVLFNGGVVADSLLLANEAQTRGGGALMMMDGVVSNCRVQRNLSNMEGGGVAFYEGGLCVGSLISSNEATEGGGAYFYRDGSLVNCVLQTNFAWSMGGGVRTYQGGLMRNCLFYHNTADPQWGFGSGGGVFLRLGGLVESCTIVANQAAVGRGGGILCNSGGTVLNSIIYSNHSENLVNPEQSAFSYCCAEPAPAGLVNFTNNPRFEGWAAWDYRLASNSPCVEQGLNQDWMTNAVDLDATARLKNLYVDIGAYESVWTNVDTDGDGLVVGIERSWFGTSDFLTDTDGDDQDDWEEGMITGTSPTDGSLYFRGFVSGAGGRPVVRWPGITDRVYAVETVVNLVTGQWACVPGGSNLEGRAGFMYYTNAFADPMRHFRPTVTRTNW